MEGHVSTQEYRTNVDGGTVRDGSVPLPWTWPHSFKATESHEAINQLASSTPQPYFCVGIQELLFVYQVLRVVLHQVFGYFRQTNDADLSLSVRDGLLLVPPITTRNYPCLTSVL